MRGNVEYGAGSRPNPETNVSTTNVDQTTIRILYLFDLKFGAGREVPPATEPFPIDSGIKIFTSNSLYA